MYAVGRLGSYITRGVSTVSGPFHPFGGAVDIVVVEQPDGSFKSSPWYVRFGKFQGVLKGKEKIVGISVNGVEADFHMYLDERGEAYFLREVEGGDAESGLSTSSSSSSSSSDETDGLCQEIKRPVKSKSCNFDAIGSKSIHLNDEKIVERTNSRRSRIFGLVFGRRSRKIDGLKDEDGDPGVERVDSLERAEIAADLLEMKWSTNLSSKNYRKDSASRFRVSVGLDSKSNEVLQMNDRNGETEDLVKNDVLCGGIPSCSQARTIVNAEYGIATGGKGVQHVSISQEAFEISNVDGGVWEEKLELLSEVTRQYEGQNRGTAVHTVNEEIVISNFVCPVSVSSCPLDQELTKFDKLDVSPTNIELAEIGNLELNREADTVEYSANQMKSESFDVGLHPSTEQHREEVYLAAAEGGEVYFETVEVKTEIIPEVKKPVITAESFDQQAEVEYICGSTEEAAIQRMFTVSGLSEKDSLSDNEKSLQEDISSALKLNLEFTADTKNSDGDCLMPKATFTPSLEGSEEDKFPLTDLDGNSINEVAFVDEVSPDSVNTSSPFSLSTQCSEVAGLNYSHEKSCASSEMEDQENISTLSENSNGRSNITSNPIDVTESRDVDVDLTGACVSHEKSCASSHIKDQESSLIVPYYLKEKTNKIPSPVNSTRSHDIYSLDLNDKSSDLFLASKESTNCMKSDTGKEEQLTQNQFNTECSQGLGGMPAAPFDPPVEVSLCRHLLYEGMGSDVASQAFEAEKLNIHKFSSIGPYVVKDERLVVRINGHYFPWEAGSPIVLGMVSFGSDHVFEMKGTIAIDKDKRTLQGDAPKATIPCDGSWRLWPFSMKKSKSRKTLRDLRSLDRANSMNEVKMAAKPKVVKRMVRSMTPTSEQLASLNLKEGSNLVTFTFSTSMLGKQQVDARIFLWKWNTRIIISDVDGTITKSDVLGQFMPLVGIDWSQTGVAPLYSAIKENGYQLLFLSARAISQAYHTRRFLFNINQDGKTLPDGPVVISPDGLFPSLYREVIRRAPHEFKIACLEEIRALFPPDHNPFYAGFGNRDTDEISYLKVGIPKGKIFIINPKGEVAVNRHVNTKSYTSLHALVNGMFPAMASFEQEDFNSWNFWKLPPPAIDV